MGVTTQRKVIDGIEFELTQLTAWDSVRMLHRLGKMFGPSLGALVARLPAAEGGSPLDADVGELVPLVAEALPKLFSSCTEEELVRLCQALLAGCTFQDPETQRAGDLMKQFDLALQGKPFTVFKLLAWSIEVNYGSFFGALGAIAKTAGGRRSSSSFPATSRPSGPAGGSSSRDEPAPASWASGGRSTK